MIHDEASSIAAQHTRWCQANRIRPWQVIASVGMPAHKLQTWDDAFAAVAIAWMNLQAEENLQLREAA